MRNLQETLLARLQLAHAPAHAHRRETLRLFLSELLQALHPVVQSDRAREDTPIEARVTLAKDEVRRLHELVTG